MQQVKYCSFPIFFGFCSSFQKLAYDFIWPAIFDVCLFDFFAVRFRISIRFVIHGFRGLTKGTKKKAQLAAIAERNNKLDANNETLGNVKTKQKSRSLSLTPRFRVVRDRQIALGPGKAELLELVAKTGSITESARRRNMSYVRAWLLIQTMNDCFKSPVLKTKCGGQSGGGAELTPDRLRFLMPT